jgi:hypothetical protein
MEKPTLQERVDERNRQLSGVVVVNEHEAAALLGRSVQSLRNWRHLRKGPAYVRQGRSISYLIEDLYAFLRAGRIDPSEAPR